MVEQTIKSFEQAHQRLLAFVPETREFRGKYTLDTMQALMAALDNPQNSYKVIHVAGTSGKTSTSYYVASMLSKTNRRVGLTISPHVSEINERVQINMVPLPEDQYCAELSEFLQIVRDIHMKPTYFELLVAFAFWEFARQKVDYAVVEVGLGGLLDGTNVITRDDKICIITDIGLDHVEVLGDTIEQIAKQKSGIIHPHNIVFCSEQDKNVLKVLRTSAQKQGANLTIVDAPHTTFPDTMPFFQQRNWWLARRAVDYVVTRDALVPINATLLEESMHTSIPARMEFFKVQGKTIIIDGAHNSQKMSTLIMSIQKRYPNQKIAVLLALVSGKNLKVKEILETLQPVLGRAIITRFETIQDMRKIALEPSEIIAAMSQTARGKTRVIADAPAAFEVLLESPEDVLLVTGSFYLLNHIRPIVLQMQHD